ncbi:MAG: hypothetical protein LBR98_08080 [Syntrophomonadaceae bacterium]|jgi:hypothetical protein|nr:hypothetical protein [Syntrophomonadaceae bacterium]
MGKKGFIAIVIVAVAILIGRQVYYGSKVNEVKNSTRYGNTSKVTYGQAFNSYFKHPKWKYFTSDVYIGVVEFTGEDRNGRDVLIQLTKEEVVYDSWFAMHVEINGQPISALNIAEYIRSIFDTY